MISIPDQQRYCQFRMTDETTEHPGDIRPNQLLPLAAGNLTICDIRHLG